MVYKSLDWSIKQEIGYLVLQQPPANSMSLEFFKELNELTEELKNNLNLQGIIISGQGRHFSSGADLEELTASIDKHLQVDSAGKIVQYPEFLRRNLQSLHFFYELKIPVVAAISGVCIGSAFELALVCHYRLCVENAVFGLPESTYGLMPGLGGIQQVVKSVSRAAAMEMVFTGTTFNANEALMLGLVDKIVPKDHLMDASEKLIKIAGLNHRQYNRKEYFHRLDNDLMTAESD
jgi:enoyl-CoA hydratase/carnithine racemase